MKITKELKEIIQTLAKRLGDVTDSAEIMEYRKVTYEGLGCSTLSIQIKFDEGTKMTVALEEKDVSK